MHWVRARSDCPRCRHACCEVVRQPWALCGKSLVRVSHLFRARIARECSMQPPARVMGTSAPKVVSPDILVYNCLHTENSALRSPAILLFLKQMPLGLRTKRNHSKVRNTNLEEQTRNRCITVVRHSGTPCFGVPRATEKKTTNLVRSPEFPRVGASRNPSRAA